MGFLWQDLPLPEAIRAATRAGFDAVECHWPYDQNPGEVKEALDETGLTMLGINTHPGELTAGEFGLSAIPGEEDRAREAIEEAIDYAHSINARGVHVMAGKSSGTMANDTFLNNLEFACKIASRNNITILVEPINSHDVPGYFLSTLGQAQEILSLVNMHNLKLMFDCYHVARSGGDVCVEIENTFPMIGHIQFASVPERGSPDKGELDFEAVFNKLDELGYSSPLGAEYIPETDTESSLEWLYRYRSGRAIRRPSPPA